MRIKITFFVYGSFLGALLVVTLAQLGEENAEDPVAVETLNFLIDEWTRDRTPIDTVVVAQLWDEPEFSDFKVGFIPDTVRSLAKIIDSLYQIPHGVTIAQWCLESRFGLSDLKARNYLGHTLPAVRPFMITPDSVIRREKVMRNGVIVTGRPVAFARYESIAHCFDVHGKYLKASRRYVNAFRQNSPERFARELSRAGYAEDPDYALKLIAIMRRYNLGN